MTRIAIFKTEIEAKAYADKVQEYLQIHRPGYNAIKWADPVPAPDGLTWIVKQPIEEEVQKWATPIDTDKSKAIGITEDLTDKIEVGKYYLNHGRVLKCVDANLLSYVQETPNSPKFSPEIMNEFHIEVDELKAYNQNADQNIIKLTGRIKNYVADLTDGVRTPATDAYVEQLISDNNVIITNQ